MTDQEKKLQRAQLQVELEDAQSELAHLQERAQAMADHVSDIVNKLRHSASLKPSTQDFSMNADLARRLAPDQQLDVSAAIKLIEELKQARQKVYGLLERKQNLANPSGMTIAV
jgi:hypothetical protein